MIKFDLIRLQNQFIDLFFIKYRGRAILGLFSRGEKVLILVTSVFGLEKTNKTIAKNLRDEFEIYRLVLKDLRTPKLPKILLWLAVGYMLLPFDLIPDFIPVVGHLDDAVIIPILVFCALKLIPEEIIQECRHRVKTEEAK